jgi:RimJ/RimL family protein N-acetyltransferase
MDSLRYYGQRLLDYLEEFGLPLRWRSLLFYHHDAENQPSLSVSYDKGGIGQPVSKERFRSFDWPGDPIVTRDAATWRRSERRWAIAAARGDTLDGFCWLEEGVAEIRFFDLECQLPDRCLYLSRVWVYPAMRDAGIGSSLLKLALAYAGHLGAERVIAGCVPHNHRMRYVFKTNGWTFYQRVDYRRVGAAMRYSVRPSLGRVRRLGSAEASGQLISRLPLVRE